MLVDSQMEAGQGFVAHIQRVGRRQVRPTRGVVRAMGIITPADVTSAFPVVHKTSPARGKDFTTALRQQNRTHQETSLSQSRKEASSSQRRLGPHFEKGSILDIFA
jgi:hypothetical protein